MTAVRDGRNKSQLCHWFEAFLNALQQTPNFNGDPTSTGCIPEKRKIYFREGGGGEFVLKNRNTFWPMRPKLTQKGNGLNVYLRASRHRCARGLFFHSLIGINISWGSTLGIIKIGTIVAKLSIENWFPIEINNLRMPAQTTVNYIGYTWCS